MHSLYLVAAGRNHRILAAGILSGCMMISGCATPLAKPLARRAADKKALAAAADDSFPSAAEVGLATGK